ncbi:hypothetical protein KOEU_37160 [Komagataeibacter europaeus]|uniref:Uncharacterized protein n=1 Tax=Komagataeibacter europaeus TaxID=33995 RepID=A0A0M0EC33_KOMEU|nr:Lar family restriction alleviation protein [Komagataeibacter europaeus]KON62798.1 hypothetical protein KOEU_37160 [Komagataeibacter europaeus]
MKTKATDLTPCPFCAGPPVTFLRDIIGRKPLYWPEQRLSEDADEGLFVGVYVFCHECGAQGEEVQEVVYTEKDVAELIDNARNAWIGRDERHRDLFESSKPVNEDDHLDKYFSKEAACKP